MLYSPFSFLFPGLQAAARFHSNASPAHCHRDRFLAHALWARVLVCGDVWFNRGRRGKNFNSTLWYTIKLWSEANRLRILCIELEVACTRGFRGEIFWRKKCVFVACYCCLFFMYTPASAPIASSNQFNTENTKMIVSRPEFFGPLQMLLLLLFCLLFVCFFAISGELYVCSRIWTRYKSAVAK